MKAFEQTKSWAGMFAHLAPVVLLAAVFGWLVGASSLISDDHMVVSVVAPAVAGMSVLGVVTMALLLSFVGGPVSSLRTGRDADTKFLRPSTVARDEPSHIHIPRRPRGEAA